MKRFLTCLFLLFTISNTSSQNIAKLSKSQNLKAISDLKDFVNHPNDALNSKDILNNINWLSKAFTQRKFNTKVLKTSSRPLFFAERNFKKASKTVLFYMHFDGQSVDTPKWQQKRPFELVVKEKNGTNYKTLEWTEKNLNNFNNRLFGRSVADDKGPIVMFLNAIDI